MRNMQRLLCWYYQCDMCLRGSDQGSLLQEVTSQGSNLMQIPGAEARQVTGLKLHSHGEGRHLVLLLFFLLMPFRHLRQP